MEKVRAFIEEMKKERPRGCSIVVLASDEETEIVWAKGSPENVAKLFLYAMNESKELVDAMVSVLYDFNARYEPIERLSKEVKS